MIKKILTLSLALFLTISAADLLPESFDSRRYIEVTGRNEHYPRPDTTGSGALQIQ